MKKIILGFLAIFIIFTYSSVYAEETEPKVVINELMWMGSSNSSFDEWIELRNLTSEKIDISSWQIKGAGTSGGDLIIPEEMFILPNSYFLVSNYKKTDENTILNIEPDWVTSSISLKNKNPKYYLIDNSGIMIDEIEKDLNEPISGEKDLKYSMERIENPVDGTLSSDWHTCTESNNLKENITDLATPGAPNSPVYNSIFTIKNAKEKQGEIFLKGTVTSLPDNLYENRMYIQDETGGLRIFLYSGEYPDFNLGDVIIVRGKIRQFHNELELKVIDYSDFTVEKEDENNLIFSYFDQDIFLDSDIGKVIKIKGIITEKNTPYLSLKNNEKEYRINAKLNTGISLLSLGSGDLIEVTGIISKWGSSLMILPRSPNDIILLQKKQSDAPVYQKLSIEELFYKNKDDLVLVTGIVTVGPKVLGKQIFYIQNINKGVQVYSYWGSFPHLELGDTIQVKGVISFYLGQRRIKISNSKDIIIMENKKILEIKYIHASEAPNHEGMLVKIKGKVEKTKGNIFYINDGYGIIRIDIKKQTGIKKGRFKKGDYVEVTGILVFTNGEFRILPRFQNDLFHKTAENKMTKIKNNPLITSARAKKSINNPEVIHEAYSGGTKYLDLIGWGMIFLALVSFIQLKKIGANEN